jgi:hypothetical protein
MISAGTGTVFSITGIVKYQSTLAAFNVLIEQLLGESGRLKSK